MKTYSIDDLKRMEADLHLEVKALELKLDELTERAHYFAETVQYLESRESVEGSNSPELSGSLPAVDFGRARNMEERLQCIAESSGGIVRVKDAVRILRESGASRAGTRSLTSAIHKILRESDNWVKIAPGTFRLRSWSHVEDGGVITLRAQPHLIRAVAQGLS